MFGGYYFFIASKIGADRRVMGIASAFEAASKMGRFFCLHRTIYTLGALWIKSAEAGSGQLCICTCNPCFESFKAEDARIEQLFSGLVVGVRY